MRTKNLLVFGILFLVILGGIGGWYIFHKKNTQTASVGNPVQTTQTQGPNPAVRLSDWGNFDGVPVLKECLLQTYDSCFPEAHFDSQGGVERISVITGTGTLDTYTLRALFLGDSYYSGSLGTFFTFPQGTVRMGLPVDTLINGAYSNGLNPLILSESVKFAIGKQFPQQNTSHTPTIATTSDPEKTRKSLTSIIDATSQELVAYHSLFLLPAKAATVSATFQGLGENSAGAQVLIDAPQLTPEQKTIILYYFLHQTRQEYDQFITNVQDRIPKLGTYALKASDEATVTNLLEQKQAHDGFTFCDRDKNQVRSCGQEGTSLLCFAADTPDICASNGYFLPASNVVAP